MNDIKIKNMSKDFQNQPILERINLTIQEGEFVGILGPSGCGKSTLLSLMAGLLKPSQGEILNSFTNQSMSFVFQEASLMPWQTVEKNIALPLELLNRSKLEIEQEVLKKLKMFRLEEAKKLYPRQISGGMKMRVSLARALISNPKLLFLDEPFSSLDQLLKEKCANDVLNIWKEQNFTSVLITHSIPEAVYLCHKIYIFSPKPSQILDVIEIDKKIQAEKSSNFRETEIFHSTCARIRTLMETFLYD